MNRPWVPVPRRWPRWTRPSRACRSIPKARRALLREAIGEFFDLDPARIVASGDGSDALLTMLANAYLRPDDEVVFGEHAFLIYKIATLANSAKPVIVREKDTNTGIKLEVDALLAAVTPKTRMVYLANPNNPTGTYLNRDEMARLHAGLPGECDPGDRCRLFRICHRQGL